MKQKALAWLVHFYTASGGVFAFLSLIEIDRGNWSQAMAWLVVCFFIDGSDGFLARKWRVREVLPMINGKDIDFVIDFVTYAFLPAYFVYRADMVDTELALLMSFYIILISAFYYGKRGMVSGKNQFSGFPVLWNLVVFYCFFVFQSGPATNAALIIGFGILHFLPIEVSYPSNNISKNKLPTIIGFSMLIILLLIVYFYPERNVYLQILAWLGFIYFIFLSIQYTWFSKST